MAHLVQVNLQCLDEVDSGSLTHNASVSSVNRVKSSVTRIGVPCPSRAHFMISWHAISCISVVLLVSAVSRSQINSSMPSNISPIIIGPRMGAKIRCASPQFSSLCRAVKRPSPVRFRTCSNPPAETVFTNRFSSHTSLRSSTEPTIIRFVLPTPGLTLTMEPRLRFNM